MRLETIRADDIFRYQGNRKGSLIDVRTKEEYMRGHIPGAVNIPYDEIRKRIGEIRQLAVDGKSGERKELILYCDRGNISLLAARDLYRLGFSVKNMHGGLKDYHGPLVNSQE